MLQDNKSLTVISTDYWGKLTPQQQSTSIGDSLLGNAFQPLVDLSISGGIAPGAAKTWEINKTNTEFTFHLSNSLTFSDGTPLRADDFIRSWLSSVSEISIDSEKPNTLDVLYKVEGFTIENARNGNVSGLTAPSTNVLKIKFKSPFRTALFELTGTRYAPWKKTPAGRIIGSGSYQIVEEIPGKLVRYTRNEHSNNPGQYEEVRVLGFKDAWAEMKTGKWPVLLGKVPENEINDNFEYLGNSIAAHQIMDVNGTKTSIFVNPNFRLALQYAIHKIVVPKICKIIPKLCGTFDPQFYPPLWPGRISEFDAEKVINSGKEYLPELIKASSRNPIRFVHSGGIASIIESELLEIGLKFQNPGSKVDQKTLIETVYSKHQFDITFGGASVVGNDPDGIYHLLGKNGAITTAEIYRQKTASLLDEGRKLLSSDDLKAHYENVNRAILEEVPVIHLKFMPPPAFLNRRLVGKSTSRSSSDRFSFNQIVL